MPPINLKPCLCLGTASLSWSGVFGGYYVECELCELSTGFSPKSDVPVKVWNDMDRPKQPKTKRKHPMESAEVNVKLPFKLTPEEVAEQAKFALGLNTEADNMEEEYGLVKRDWNKKLKDLKLKSRMARQVYESQIENREVKAHQYFDLDTGKCWYSYGGQNYLERELTDEEREQLQQGTIFGDGANIPGSEEAQPVGF